MSRHGGTPEILQFVLFAAVLIILIGFFREGCARAELPEELAVKCVLGEYEAGTLRDMTATAEALRNRGTTQGVYGCKAVSVRGGKYYRGKRRIPDYAVSIARQAWKDARYSNLTDGGTHWEAVETFGTPYWAKNMVKTGKVGLHTYYK